MKKSIIVLLIFILFTSTCIQSYSQSKVERGILRSEILNADREYSIYLPKSYNTETERKYPILYLLHGMTDTDQKWYDRGHVNEVIDQLVASGEACEMIIVSPNAGGSFEDNAWNGYFDMPGWKYEAFFFSEFLPFIEKKYRVASEKQYRAIAGLSMGGGGCTSYAQRYSHMFCAAYAMSALMTIPEPVSERLKNQNEKYVLLTLSVIENSCVKYVEEADDERKEELSSIHWFVDCGDDDHLLDCNMKFIQAMKKAGIPVQFRVRDGGHTWEYWNSALYTCLPFVSRSFGNEEKAKSF